MRRTFGKTNRRFPVYQVAGTLLVVATLGFTAIYFGQRGQDMAQKEEAKQQAKVEIQEEETQDVSAVVEPIVDEVTEPLLAPEVVINLPKEEISEEPAQETAAAEVHFGGELGWPLEGKVILPYSMDKTVFFSTLQQYQYNPAVIIGAKVNDTVVSAAPGKVSSIETSPKTGCTVTVNLGDGYEAVYGQLKEVSLATGDTLKTGDLIGYISEPTKYYSLEGANLYFQLKHEGQAVNPMEYLKETE